MLCHRWEFDGVPAIGADVEVRGQIARGDRPILPERSTHPVVPSAPGRARNGHAGGPRKNEPRVFGGVEVYHERPGRTQADVVGRVLIPPFADLFGVGDGVEVAVGRRRLLVEAAREHGIAHVRILQGRVGRRIIHLQFSLR